VRSVQGEFKSGTSQRLDRMSANLAQLDVPRYVPIRRVDSSLLKVEGEAKRSEERFLSSLGMAVRLSGSSGVPVNAGQKHRGTQRILTARAARRATMVKEIRDWSIVPALAQRERTAVSVGEKAVLVLKARKR